jgi:hypothetical protein
MVEKTEGPHATEAELEDMIAATDTGARSPVGNIGKLLLLIAFFWSVFQLWIASPLPYMDMFSSWLPVLNNTDTFNSPRVRRITRFSSLPRLKKFTSIIHSNSGLDTGACRYCCNHVSVCFCC